MSKTSQNPGGLYWMQFLGLPRPGLRGYCSEPLESILLSARRHCSWNRSFRASCKQFRVFGKSRAACESASTKIRQGWLVIFFPCQGRICTLPSLLLVPADIRPEVFIASSGGCRPRLDPHARQNVRTHVGKNARKKVNTFDVRQNARKNVKKCQNRCQIESVKRCQIDCQNEVMKIYENMAGRMSE